MKKPPKLTPWFPENVKPLRHGVYECRGIPSEPSFQHWNGVIWGGWARDRATALKNRDHPSVRQSPQWRGLDADPVATTIRSIA